jgi:5-(carboxyamino)imidazole ribonucleotide mutase
VPLNLERLGEKDRSAEMLNETEKIPRRPLVSIAVPSLKLFEDLKDAKTALDFFGIKSEVSIVAAHWAPKKTLRFIAELESKGFEVIIASADGSAHLPGMIASLTTIPVIGVPLRGPSLDGIDSLLSIVQMPHGVPVGTMGINAAHNAGVFACQILSLKYPQLREKLKEHKQKMEERVESEDAKQRNAADI